MILKQVLCQLLALAGCAANPAVDSGATEDSDAPSASLCTEPHGERSYTRVDEVLVDSSDDEPFPMAGSPVVFADMDGDGDDDLVLGLRAGGVHVHENTGEGFAVHDALSPTLSIESLSIGDVDGDGDLDLFVSGWSLRQYVQLFVNQGGLVFEDQTEAWGLDAVEYLGESRHATFGDADLDGDLDLVFISTGKVFLFENFYSRLFVDRSDVLEPGDENWPALTWQALWIDVDADLDPDLVFALDLQQEFEPSRVLLNEGDWNFTQSVEESGLAYSVNAMGASSGDIDNDGDPDVLITSTGPQGLYSNLGDGSYVDVTASEGAAGPYSFQEMGFGSALFDHDNDGLVDIFLVGGRVADTQDFLDSQDDEQPDTLLVQGTDGFSIEDFGISDDADGRGVALGDLDHDGALDLVVGNVGTPSALYRAACSENAALVVELVGTRSNSFGIGARVDLTTSAGTQTRWITENTGLAAASHPRAHFGLGDATVEELVVTWPSGEVQEVEVDAFWLIVEEP